MRLTQYSFKILHIPGRELLTANVLSRASLKKQLSEDGECLDEELNLYVSHILETFPVTEKTGWVKTSRPKWWNMQKVIWILYGRQAKWKQKTSLKPYWSEWATITAQRGLLLKDQRIAIPSSLRLDILDKLHTGRQGIRKCHERPRDSVWWPGLSKQIEDVVTTCTTWCKQRRNYAEPMMSTTLPEWPWQKIGVDLFYHNGKEYTIAVD